MVQRDDHRMIHPDDHIRHNDETFQYQGTLPMELVTKFVDENQPRIAFLKGFIAVGKTRTSKEFARLLAERFRGQRNRAKVHTFLFDLRHKSVETLLSDILRVFKDKVQGWNYGNIENVDQLSSAFEKETDRVFILVLDNVDRVHDKERPNILEFVQELVSGTGNVHLVVTGRTDVSLVRNPTQVMKHHMKPLEQKYAKELLKETSGNPEGFDKYADNIVDLVGGLPLALMIAGNEMNKKSTQLPYTPEEFVALMTDSLSLSLDLENVPTEDRIISRVTDIVKENWTVLKKLVIALDYPQMFDTEDLKEAMVATSGSSVCDWQIKRTLILVLRRSVYGLNGESGSADSLESAPLLIEVLKETFCQMTCKDGFLKDFNKCLKNMLDDTSDLMRSGAKELRQAELHLLRNQKGPKVTPQEVQELRTNVITKAYEFLGTVEVDAKMCTNFQTQCIQIQNKWEREEAHKVPPRVGIQETSPDQKERPVICCRSPLKIPSEGLKKDLEAYVSPTTPQNIVLPSMKDINQANDSSKTTMIEAENDSSSEVTKTADVTNPQKEENGDIEHGDIEHSARESKGLDEITSNSTGNKTLYGQAVSQDSSCDCKTVVKEESSTSDVKVTQDNNMSTAFKSQRNDHTKSIPSNVSTDDSSLSIDLCKTCDKSMSLDALSLPGSLHSPDCREPTQESVSSQVTYSALPTLPDHHVLTSSPNLERKEGDDRQHIDNSISPTGMSTKEAVESEFDWEHGDNEEVGESTEEAIADKKPCNAVTQADRKKDHPRGETKREVRKPPQLPGVQTTIVTTSTTATETTTTKGTPADGPRQSHPKIRRNETRGQGILGSTPSSSSSSSSSSSLHSPAYPQDPRFPAHYNPVLDQNTSFPPPMDRRCVYGNQGVREQCQMLPGPILPPNVQGGSYHGPPYKGGSVPYNQFGREYNDLHYQESYYNGSDNTPTSQFTKNSGKFSQAHDHEPAFLSDGSYPSSDFQPQGPMYGYPQTNGPPFQSHVSTPPPRLQTQSSSNSFSQACGPPHHSNVSSPTSSFLPQGPSCKFPQAYVPPFPDHGSTIPPSFQTQSFSDGFSQARGPPLMSNVSSPSSSFRPRGPPSLNAPSLPGSLRTNGFYTPPRHMNGPPNRPYQRDYGHDQHGQHQQGQHQQGQHQQGQHQQGQHQQGQHQQRQHQQGQHQQGQYQQGQHQQRQHQQGQHQQRQHQQGQHQQGHHQQGHHQQGQHQQGQYQQQPRYGYQRNCHYY
ncbi:RNA polymerase II degradation factor 1 [Strongylocentrotus purpuratus]|uniref:ORC1/DEAH AAA+ ATPase domain-containing protein n=1 Tax=Strongylocentrotus purpuratus TaxID=7668 RepID=A0A7M7PME0_STRPU|nr:RNA polymerase II degradation factor 1 [Strongylocentrotus purpuratus]XP_030853418.1 RNA polymerase II degradation factor 1 [Strongylocentrotus purpuratus]